MSDLNSKQVSKPLFAAASTNQSFSEKKEENHNDNDATVFKQISSKWQESDTNLFGSSSSSFEYGAQHHKSTIWQEDMHQDKEGELLSLKFYDIYGIWNLSLKIQSKFASYHWMKLYLFKHKQKFCMKIKI